MAPKLDSLTSLATEGKRRCEGDMVFFSGWRNGQEDGSGATDWINTCKQMAEIAKGKEKNRLLDLSFVVQN